MIQCFVVKTLQSIASSERAVASQPGISFVYIGKIFLAIIFIFVLAAVFTLALENLPTLILFINSSM